MQLRICIFLLYAVLCITILILLHLFYFYSAFNCCIFFFSSSPGPNRTSLVVPYFLTPPQFPPYLFLFLSFSSFPLRLPPTPTPVSRSNVLVAMSLNGLDNPTVLEAYQTVLTEAGGW